MLGCHHYTSKRIATYLEEIITSTFSAWLFCHNATDPVVAILNDRLVEFPQRGRYARTVYFNAWTKTLAANGQKQQVKSSISFTVHYFLHLFSSFVIRTRASCRVIFSAISACLAFSLHALHELKHTAFSWDQIFKSKYKMPSCTVTWNTAKSRTVTDSVFHIVCGNYAGWYKPYISGQTF